MAILDGVTVAAYELTKLHLEQDVAGDISATFELMMYSVLGTQLTSFDVTITLTPGEADVLKTFVAGKLTDFETATGLVKFTPPGG